MVGVKKAYIITGAESSGGRFIARVIAYVLGKDKEYKSWNGVGFLEKPRDTLAPILDVVILHRSQPFGFVRNKKKGKEAKYSPLKLFQEKFREYELNFIITTRDSTIINESRISRHKRNEEKLDVDHLKVKRILSDIIKNERCFIWNYETQNSLGHVYFQQLYDFLGVKTDFFPPDLFDANRKYYDSENNLRQRRKLMKLLEACRKRETPKE